MFAWSDEFENVKLLKLREEALLLVSLLSIAKLGMIRVSSAYTLGMIIIWKRIL